MGINPLSFVINKKMQKRTFLTAVIATTALATVPAWATDQRKLVVGMDATYPPFGSKDTETRQYVGYDVAIIRAIGKAEGFEVDVKNLAFDGLIPALKTGNIDIAINDITITPERAKTVDFSKVDYIMYNYKALSIIDSFEAARLRDAENFVGTKAQVEMNTGYRVTNKVLVRVRKHTA